METSPSTPPVVTIKRELLETLVWGFVFVRCTYADDARWASFLSKIQEQSKLSDSMARTQPWTTIEDQETLDNATMTQASLAFQNWAETLGANETQCRYNRLAPRYEYYVFVNEESMESVLDAYRARERTGNFFILVNARWNLTTREEKLYDPQTDKLEEISVILADEPDISFRLISATAFVRVYLNIWSLSDDWYDATSDWTGLPWVYYRKWEVGGDMTDESLLRYHDIVGFDAYKMLKKIYGKGHPRSFCFQADEPETKLQKLTGYGPGYWQEPSIQYELSRERMKP